MISELFSSLKAPLPTVRPIAKGIVTHVNVILPYPSDTDTGMRGTMKSYLSSRVTA